MSRSILLGAASAALISLCAAASAGAANPTSLLVPQSTAFSFLGHSCGGIQEQAFATGFDPLSGLPVGDVYLQTRCGGSGRGGGYKVTTYSAWTADTWTWSGALSSDTRLAGAPSGLDPAFSAFDAAGDEVYDVLNAVNVLPANCTVSNTTYCTYRAYLNVVAPAAPTGVTVTPSGGQYVVGWAPDPNAAAQITSSTVTATPESSTASPVTVTVTGNATSTLIGPLQPQTTYDVTVVSTDAGASSPASAPVTVTTPAASLPPSAPTGVGARWTAPGSPGDTLVATWSAGAPGDSPTDAYQVEITGSDGGGTFDQTVDGSTLTATFAVSDVPDWTVRVRAHDAAGWSAWSASYMLGGA